MDIGQLLQDKQKKVAPPPELLFDINGARSLNTIHENKNKPTEQRKSSTAIAFDLQSSVSSGRSSGSSESGSSNNGGSSDEDSTSSHAYKKRSNSQAPTGVELAPPAPEGVGGSAQGSTLGG